MTQNKKEIRVFGLRRCGQHAIINWFISQVDGPICYINDFSKTRIKKGYKIEKIDNSYTFGRNFHFYNIEKSELMKENIFSIENKELFIFNVEDEELKIINRIEKFKFYPKKKGKEIYNILILRDPYNLFASRLKLQETKNRVLLSHKSINMWISYAKEYLGLTSYLHNRITINYNKWISSKEYRKKISSQLGLEYKDIISEVPNIGGGSSFDGRKFNGRSNEMNVLERWKHFKTNNRYLIFMNNAELVKLANRIFGNINDNLIQNYSMTQHNRESIRTKLVDYIISVLELINFGIKNVFPDLKFQTVNILFGAIRYYMDRKDYCKLLAKILGIFEC